MPLMHISSYIAAKQTSVDDYGKIVEQLYTINFSKAHALFSDVARNLREYRKIIGYLIAQSTLGDESNIAN